MKILNILLCACLFFIPLSYAQTVSDEDISARVSRAIGNDEMLQGLEILVVSVNGYVMLTGQATSSEQKQQASFAAAFASNDIRRLINEVEIVDVPDNNFEDTDQAIVAQIDAVIPTMSPATRPVIYNGVVYLLGQVSREEGDNVAQTISRMSGVKNIRISYEYVQ